MSKDTFTISQGQGHEVEQALGRNSWTNALLKKATKGDFFAKVRLVLEGKAEIVMIAADKVAKIVIQKTTDLLRLVKEVALRATAEKSVGKSFVGPRYYYRDPALDSCLAKVSPAGIEGKIMAYQLEKELTFQEVAQAILGMDEATADELAKGLIAGGHTVVLSQIEALIESTDAGEDTGLLTNGYGNFFFVEDKDESVSVVSARRHDARQWDVYVARLANSDRWDVEARFFSRNLGTVSL